MDLFTAIAARYSYRGTYADEPVSTADLEKIVESAIHAPTACNAQSCSFVIVTDPELLKGISRLFDNRPFAHTAKAFIAVVADEMPVYRDTSFYLEDCAAAAENMLLAITALGYASVWLDGVLRVESVAETLNKMLHIPAPKHVQILLPIGVPAEPGTPMPKKAFAERAFFNRYGG